MNRNLLGLSLLLGCVLTASAHVGSPNVFFDGKAGAYAISAIVRPPKALPGAAQVSVKVRDAGIQSLSLLPILWQAGSERSPEPVLTRPLVAETNSWVGEAWLLRPGSYTIRIGIEGPLGKGEANVPVNVLGIANQPMKSSLRFTLLVFSFILFLSALGIVHAIARDAFFPSGLKASLEDMNRARWATLVVLLSLSAGIAAGSIRWRKMDSDFRNFGAQKPEPVIAEIKNQTNKAVLLLRQSEQSLALPSWANLAPDHGKLMHLFLMREPGFDVFAHLHPVRQDEHGFALELPPLPVGDYQLYGDITFENGIAQTLVARVALPEPKSGTFTVRANSPQDVFCGFNNTGSFTASDGPDPDDSWHVEPNLVGSGPKKQLFHGEISSLLMGGFALLFENAADVTAGRAAALRFSAYAADGAAAPLQPYMGMLGHAVVRRDDGSVFAHLHPMGTFSMAAQEAFQKQNRSNASSTRQMIPAGISANEVSFPYEFPKAGHYHLWVQIRIGGKVLTGVYEIDVRAPRSA